MTWQSRFSTFKGWLAAKWEPSSREDYVQLGVIGFCLAMAIILAALAASWITLFIGVFLLLLGFLLLWDYYSRKNDSDYYVSEEL